MSQAGPAETVRRLLEAVNAHDLEAMVGCFAEDYVTEWDISGTRRDGAPFALRGVVIFGVTGDVIASARFYLEPVEETSGDVDAHTARVVDAGTDAGATA